MVFLQNPQKTYNNNNQIFVCNIFFTLVVNYDNQTS